MSHGQSSYGKGSHRRPASKEGQRNWDLYWKSKETETTQPEKPDHIESSTRNQNEESDH